MAGSVQQPLGWRYDAPPTSTSGSSASPNRPTANSTPLLAEAYAIVGQPDLPRERLDRAPHLRALLNVEGNFFPNVDYTTCFRRGIVVLGCGPAYATAVAE